MPNNSLQHDDETNELARVEPSVPVPAAGTTAQTANGLSQHTPGPWELDVIDERAKRELHLDSPVAIWIAQTAPGGEVVATVEDVTVERAFANARLIAAAPDLLLSVKEFVALYVGTRDMLGPSVQAKLARAEAAIQKAGGQ